MVDEEGIVTLIRPPNEMKTTIKELVQLSVETNLLPKLGRGWFLLSKEGNKPGRCSARKSSDKSTVVRGWDPDNPSYGVSP